MSSRVPYRLWLIIAACASLMNSSCGGGGGGQTASAAPANSPQPTRAVEQSNEEIAAMVYGLAARVPTGFYTESNDTGYAFVSTSHLKNTDIEPSTDSDAPMYELCTDDWAEALAWSELTAQHAPQYAELVANDDHPRYFEFGRFHSGEPALYQRQRVFKCSYLQRDSANLRDPLGDAGVLSFTPVTAADLRTLAEYLWTFSVYNNLGHAALKSVGTGNGDTLTHTIYTASLERHGISAACDRIEVFAWRHTLNVATGELQLAAAKSFDFGATENAGVVDFCEE